MGVQMINGYLKNIRAKLRSEGHLLSDSKVIATEMLLGVILSAVVAVILQIDVFGVFRSSHSSSIWIIFLFTFLCCLTMYFQFKMISLFLGRWGMLRYVPYQYHGYFL